MTELYSYEKYRGYHLFVEAYSSEDEEKTVYEGVAQVHGTTMFSSSSDDGKKAETLLMDQIDKSGDLDG
jgi:hypothetical protein